MTWTNSQPKNTTLARTNPKISASATVESTWYSDTRIDSQPTRTLRFADLSRARNAQSGGRDATAGPPRRSRRAYYEPVLRLFTVRPTGAFATTVSLLTR